MAATVVIQRFNGAGASATIMGANTVGGTEDAAQILADASLSTSPIQIPVSGTNYGYWVTTGLDVVVAPATAINNIRWYTDGTDNLGTGVALKTQDDSFIRASQYDQASGIPGVTGNPLSSHLGVTGSIVNAFSFTSGAPLNVVGSIGSTTGALGEYVVYQFEVINTASPGPTAQETITWAFDES